MTIVSLTLVALYIYILVKKDDQLVNAITLLLLFCINNINIGGFMTVGGVVLSYIDWLTACTFFICLSIVMKRPQVDRKVFAPIVVLILVVFIGIIRLSFSPPAAEVVSYSGSWDSYFRGNKSMLQSVSLSMQSVLQLIRTILFFFIITVIKSSTTIDDWKIILRRLVISSRYLMPVYLLDAFCMLLGNSSFYNFRNWIFGGTYMLSKNRLSGLSTEPSYYAVTIFLVVSINLLYGKMNNEIRDRYSNSVTCFIYIVLGVLSGSFSFLWTGVLLILLWFTCKNRLSLKQFCLVTTILLSVFIFQNNGLLLASIGANRQPFSYRLENMLQSIVKFNQTGKMMYSSEGTRMGSIQILLKAWKERPLLGLGIGTTFCFSGIVSIMATVGLLGLVLWYYIVFYAYPKQKTIAIINIIFVLAFVPAGDFELFYGFNAILWAEVSSMMFNYRMKSNKKDEILT